MSENEIKQYKAIIGNGFDLNLGLKTSYQDFLQSTCLEKINPQNSLAKHFSNQKQLKNWVDVEESIEEITIWNNLEL